jgi:uncharacterized glyoxalase superfamily protein PhnB
MLANRSVPTDALLAHIFYEDVSAAAEWLVRAFGFIEHFRYGDPIQGAQLRLARAVVMLGLSRPGRASPAQVGVNTEMLSIFIEDVEAHYHGCLHFGVSIIEPLHTTAYGELQYVAEDPEGHHWLFARHERDIAPSEWGATSAAVK